MNSKFQAFIDSLSRCPDAVGLTRAMEGLAAIFDLDRFAYLLGPSHDPSGVKLISNYPPKWTNRYLGNGYDRCDPVINQVYRTNEAFEWGECLWNRPLVTQESQLMDEASAFGIRCGFTFPMSDPKCRFAAVTFASDLSPERFRRCFQAHHELLNFVATMFHAEARRALAPPWAIGDVRLTEREFECLTWAVRGKSAWDTGQILGITQRTVAFHLHNAKSKLDVRTIQQAVALMAAARRSEN